MWQGPQSRCSPSPFLPLNSIPTLSRLTKSVQAHTELCQEAEGLLGMLSHIQRALRKHDAQATAPAKNIPAYSIERLELF